MKKIVSVVLFFCMIFANTCIVKAEGELIGFIATAAQEKITEGETEATINLKLGEIVGLDTSEYILGYQLELEYDENVESVTVNGIGNTWSGNTQYTASTKKLVGDSNGTPTTNTNIATINLKLKSGIEAGTKIDVKIKNILVAYQSMTTDESYTQDIQDTPISFTIEAAEIDDEEIEEETNKNEINENTNQNTELVTNEAKTNNTTNNTQVKTNNDTTVAKTNIPAAGIKNAIILAICVTVIVAITCKIKSRKIKY